MPTVYLPSTARLVARVLLILGLSFGVVRPCFAWGELGHATICQIAWLQLTSDAQDWLQPFYRAKGYDSFASACNWADHIKSQSRYDYLKPWHYVNVPRGARHYTPQLAQCGQQSCVTEAIDMLHADISRGQSEDVARDVLLLAHFIGDIHQPMHVSWAEDWGGNKLTVKVPGQAKPENLHWLWDVWLLEQAGLRRYTTAAPKLLREISPKQLRHWQQADQVNLWAKESYRHTVKIYREYRQGKTLGPAYVRRHRSFVVERIQQAGVRLAYRLEQLAKEDMGHAKEKE